MIQVNQTMISDISLLNEFKTFRDVKAVDMYSQKLLVLKVEDKGNRNLLHWYFGLDFVN